MSFDIGADLQKAYDEGYEDGKRDAAPRWVRCEEELPKSVVNKVLVFCDSEDRYPYVGFGHYEKYDGKETWYNLENGKPFTEWEYTVTHWMPLPEPPKEGE